MPDPWVIVPDSGRSVLEAEFSAELAEEHDLSGMRTTAIARCQVCDDVVFRVEAGPIWFALVHLTWRGRRESTP